MMTRWTYRLLRWSYVARQWLSHRLTPAGLGVLACLIITAAVGLGSTRSMSHLLFFFSLALFGLSVMGSRWIHGRFSVTRTLPHFGTVEEPLQYEVILQNLTPIPQQGLKFVEIFPNRFPSFRDFRDIKARYPIGKQWMQPWRHLVDRQQGAIASLQVLPPLLGETKTKITGEILPLRRGRLTLEAITLACPDPLGLIYKRYTYPLRQSVCILPKRYQLPPLHLSKTRRYQMGETALVSSIGEALEFRALRDYRPGDPTNKIHWKSWAKVGRPIVKEQQDESAIHHALVLDTFMPESYSEVFEAAIAVAVSFLVREQPEEALLDVIFSAQKVRCVTVGRGLRQRGKVLEAIATLTPSPDGELEQLMPVLQSRLSQLSGCLCLFINLDATRYAFLKKLSQSGIPIKALFLCEQTMTLDEDLGQTLTPNGSTHLLGIDHLQQELWSL